MGESRGGECLIKLFGMTIPVPENGDAKDLHQHSGSGSSSTESDVQENAHQQDTGSDSSPQPEVVDAEDPRGSPEQQPPSDGGGEEKEKLKKPDKVLPCPRCSSMDTKFCYFNNYNVNQPRHFCKNCQRYWTAGGTMRNVPVGASRRKNKNAAAAYHFLQRVRAAAGAGDPLTTNNGTVLSFGGHVHGAPALDLAAEQAGHLNEKKLLDSIGSAGDPSVGSSTEGSSNRDDDKNYHGVIKEKVTMERPAANGVVHHPAAMNGAAMWPYSCAPSPAYYSSGFAIPVYPAAPGYWGCMVPPGAWSLPWPVQSTSPTSAPSVSSSGPDHSLSLGKHPREGEDEGRGRHGGSGKVWAPKTIRIDDADEVARSSIWSLIGIKGDKKDTADTGAHKLGTAFEPKTAKQAVIASSPFLHANPVALTRSVTFQEGS